MRSKRNYNFFAFRRQKWAFAVGRILTKCSACLLSYFSTPKSSTYVFDKEKNVATFAFLQSENEVWNSETEADAAEAVGCRLMESC